MTHGACVETGCKMFPNQQNTVHPPPLSLTIIEEYDILGAFPGHLKQFDVYFVG